MEKTYDFLRSELEENIKKQDTISDFIFTILGISFAFSTWFEDCAFIITILFISDILLARIIQCRNTVYYISTYLSVIEETSDINGIKWEKDLKEFRKLPYGLPFEWNLISIINVFSSRTATLIKNFGNLVLALFMESILVHIIITSEIELLYLITIIVLSIVFLIINIAFTITICTDKKLRVVYEKRWKDILNKTND